MPEPTPAMIIAAWKSEGPEGEPQPFRMRLVRDLLGHASILTTERYENQRLEALQAAVERLEGGKTYPTTEAADTLSRIFQDPTEQRFAESEDPAKESATSH